MHRLNPYAIPYVPPQYQEENNKKKDMKPNGDGYSKQGWKKYTNKKGKKNKNNNKHIVKETTINVNRFSRLNNMVGDDAEVMQLLSEAEKKENIDKEKIKNKSSARIIRKIVTYIM